MTGKITIGVLRVRGGWRVMKDDRISSDHDYRIDAEEAGFDLTRRLHREGRDVELVVQRDGTHDLEPMFGWEMVP